MKRLLCLWLPNWPVQRHRSGESIAASADPGSGVETPESADSAPTARPARPLILWHADPRRGRVVAACCPLAAALGVRRGVSLAQAIDIAAAANNTATKGAKLKVADAASTSPDPLVAMEHDRARDTAALNELAIAISQHVCPKTAVETLDRFTWAGRFLHLPEAIVCDLHGVTHLFGDEPGVLTAAARLLADRGLHARMAVADTLGAAWALAHFARGRRRQNDRFAFFVAPPGQTVQAVGDLPCQALRLSPEEIRQLGRLGVETIGSLLTLPRDGLATRLGQPLVRRIAQLLGDVDEPIVSVAPPLENAASLELEYPTDAVDLLQDRWMRLIDEATAPLRPRQRGVLRLRGHLEFGDHPPLTLESGLFAPTLDQQHLSGLLIAAMTSHRLPSLVTRLSVVVTGDAPLSQSQSTLFGATSDSGGGDWTRQPGLARLIDSLAGRLGEASVRGVRLTDDPLPENAVESFPLTASRLNHLAARQRRVSRSRRLTNEPGTAPEMDRGPQRGDPGRRPLSLLDPPVAITAIADDPAPIAENQFPPKFRYRGQQWTVVRHWGPERIETGWWRGTLVRRDYFRVELHDGSRWWLFRNLAAESNQDAGSWLIHGLFD